MHACMHACLYLPTYVCTYEVSCTAPATRHASLQMLLTCPTPAKVFQTATKSSRFAHFWEGADSLALAMQNHILTSKSVPRPPVFYTFDLTCASRRKGVHFFIISASKSAPSMVCFVHFHFKMCFAPQGRALFQHLNFQKWTETFSSTCA